MAKGESVDPAKIRYLIAIADAGGIAPAARRLGVSEVTLSRAARHLERLWGVDLLVRGSRPMRLTQEGVIAVQSGRRALQHLESIERDVTAIGNLEDGELTIMTLPSLAERVVRQAVAQFALEHPGVRLRITGPEQPLLEYVTLAVESGKADIAVSEMTHIPRGLLRIVDLGSESFRGILPPGTPVPVDGVMALDDFVNLGLIAGPYWGHSPAWRRLGSVVGEDRTRPFVWAGVRDVVLHLVAEGVGVALATEDLAGFARALGAEVVQLSPPITRRICAITRRGAVPPAVMEFLDYLIDGQRSPI